MKTKVNLRDIFFCLVTEEQKIGLLRLNIAEKSMAGNDREPIGRKGKPTRRSNKR